MPVFQNEYEFGGAMCDFVIVAENHEDITFDVDYVPERNGRRESKEVTVTIDVVRIDGKKMPFYMIPAKLQQTITIDVDHFLRRQRDE